MEPPILPVGALLSPYAPEALCDAIGNLTLHGWQRNSLGDYLCMEYIFPISRHYPSAPKPLFQSFTHSGLLFWSFFPQDRSYFALKRKREVLFGYLSRDKNVRVILMVCADPLISDKLFFDDTVTMLKRRSVSAGMHLVRD